MVKNKFSASDQTKAVNETQEVMKQNIVNNESLMHNAQVKAQKLIQNYIDMLGNATGTHYNVTWEYEDGTTSTQIPDEAEVVPTTTE